MSVFYRSMKWIARLLIVRRQAIVMFTMVAMIIMGVLWASQGNDPISMENKARQQTDNLVDQRFEEIKGDNVNLVLVNDKLTGCSFIAKTDSQTSYVLLPNTCNK